MVRVKVQESDGGCCEDGSYVMSKIRLNFVSPEARSGRISSIKSTNVVEE